MPHSYSFCGGVLRSILPFLIDLDRIGSNLDCETLYLANQKRSF